MTDLTRREELVLIGGTTIAMLTGSGQKVHANDRNSGSDKVTPDLLNAWLALRGGEDSPAYWYSEGLIRPIKAGGAVQSRMVGMETWVTPPGLRTETSAVSLSRKIFFFLDREEDKIVIDPATGKPRRPSIFAYQVRRFTLINGATDYKVESHDLRGIRQGGTGVTYTVTKTGDQLHVNYASFPRRAGPDGAMQVRSGEVYDYVDNGPAITDPPARYQMTWVGTNLDGDIANQRGHRYDSFEAIPNAWLKDMIRDKAPLWTGPPKEMAEIEALRATVPFAVPGLGL